MTPLSIFGIRHHGPGSARSLLLALERLDPDLILIEGPPDADALLAPVADPQMAPPVALLVYNPQNLRQASFYPFAEYSPEWQAIRFGLQRQIPVRFMDLPLSLAFGLPENDLPDVPFAESPKGPSTDPFTEIARLAGYTDPERWWEAAFERRHPGSDLDTPEVFTLILELMSALRESKTQTGAPESNETVLREAYMRQTIRLAQKEGYRRIAVVCGAWHVPALHQTPQMKAAADAALLKGLKKTKTKSTWIPWSFDRLATQSGYGAGVLAPAWYRILWNAGAPGGSPAAQKPHMLWLAQAAQVLRAHDFGLSPAHVLEAVRLAETLAALRNTLLPGIEELREAAVTILCEGAEKPYALIETRLVVGDVLGTVPDSVPVVPLRADFEAQVRSARLTLNTEEQTLHLDLREEAHLRKSRLLHRLQLLHIPWGKAEQAEGRKEGRFHESWTLKWLPDYEIRLIEAGAWGNTLETAASRRAQHAIRSNDQLSRLVALLSTVLKADLPAVFPLLLQKLSNVSAIAQDALELADTVLPLVEVLRYGHARRLDLASVALLLDQLVPRACIQLPAACMGVDETVSTEILKKILAVHRALGLLGAEAFAALWIRSLVQIEQTATPMLSGLSARLLWEQNAQSPDQTATTMQYRLSHAQPPQEAALWLEGFLHGSGLLLLHQPALWQILDAWIAGIYAPDFPVLLPLLRRTFSRFSGPEREKMLDLARRTATAHAGPERDSAEWDARRVALVHPLVRRILGG